MKTFGDKIKGNRSFNWKKNKKQVNPASLVDHSKIKILLMISLFFREEFKSIALSDRLDLTLRHTLCN